jgi:hypothetical protein
MGRPDARCADATSRQPSGLVGSELIVLKEKVARVTGLEPATSGVTGRHSNRLSYTRAPPLGSG